MKYAIELLIIKKFNARYYNIKYIIYQIIISIFIIEK